MKNNFVVLQLEHKENAHIYNIEDVEIILALDKLLFNMQFAASYGSIPKVDIVKLIGEFYKKENQK